MIYNEQPNVMSSVKRVLRRQDSGQYLMEGGWTFEIDEAIDFVDSLAAAEICIRLGLKDIDLVLRVPSGDLFCTPLR